MSAASCSNSAGKNWGGWTYGGYALDSQHMFAGVASAMFGKTVIWTTHDGGQTFQNTELDVTGHAVEMGALGTHKMNLLSKEPNPNIKTGKDNIILNI